MCSKDFLNNVDFTHLLCDMTNSTKNKSSHIFLKLHDDTFEVLTGVIQQLFQSEMITELSATLDKVTIHHRSYTVLLSFFFYEGSIYCLLNSLLKMEEDDYDVEGTGTLIVNL